MQIGKVVVIEPTDTIFLRTSCRMRKEDMEEDEKYFKERWGINVKIIDSSYELVGVKTDG